MVATLIRVQLPHLTGGLADADTNDFVFDEGAGVPFAATDSLMFDFYNQIFGAQTNPLSFYISQCVRRDPNAISLTYYDITGHLDGSAAGPPVHLHDFTLSAADAGSVPLPEQVSVVINHHASFGFTPEFGPTDTAIPTPDAAVDMGAPAHHTGKDRLRSRLRGRLYLPPLQSSVLDVDASTKETRLAPLFHADMIALATGWSALAHSIGADWAVWSRRNASLAVTTGGWIRNSFQTARRRAIEDGAKTFWP